MKAKTLLSVTILSAGLALVCDFLGFLIMAKAFALLDIVSALLYWYLTIKEGGNEMEADAFLGQLKKRKEQNE